MKKLSLLIIFTLAISWLQAQTDLTVAVDFHVKTVSGETIKLFPLLDEQNKIVVIDFFSTSCGPCQDYAPDFQSAYEIFDSNNGNVYFVGINTNSDNQEVMQFDSIFGLTYPSVSGIQGGGDNVYEAYHIMSYPTVIVITPDHQIVEQSIWPPSQENIVNAVFANGGLMVGNQEIDKGNASLQIYPNPVGEKAFLSINSDVETSIDFNIFGQFGNPIYFSNKIILNQGFNQIKLPVEILNNGIYFVMVKGDGIAVETVKFIVAK